MDQNKIILSEKDMPQAWYNILPDLPAPFPPHLHPGTMKPLGPADLAPLFPMELIKQEVSMERFIPIPDDIQRIYKLWRPSPLHRAYRLEKALGTPARIYYKNESVSPAGSHKPNTAVAQAYYNKKEGVTRLATETGAGQWGSALAFACNLFGLKCTVYMVKVSYEQKPYRKIMMQTWGAEVHPSPTTLTNSGKAALQKDPNCPGSLGLAISEAVEDAATHDDTKYSLGSVLNHVLMHQTIVGLEVEKQLKIAKEKPDIMIGCVGGGSNFGGFMMPFVREKMKGRNIRFIAVEPTSCPSLTKGPYIYDYGDVAKLAPIAKMYTLGHGFIPPAIHAGGLRYHGDAPILCLLVNKKLIEAVAYDQKPVFEAALMFARTEGIIPAPETAHAIKAVIDEALKCKASNEAKCIVFNFSGHGHFDLAAYDAYLSGKLEDFPLPEEKIKEALKDVPKVD
ncbi:TrpB-like pyridoxal phosphate-dependent enzyme [Candidatus Desantisbacteria bacterium CG_4_10_14_0_8_um_filter_48_22]|uniref:Tryptophan synthase beta chain n=1 Tax=Candidatus Desantisbacteria bacterium CG_4_10_14_0_8_um_filter_48_22 TaxID=1974543 RepID=A0A2M7S745_9BACT|nr:MAG: TrpB-like pyridoxal-phosphate dependent enzyme [Candidatus Desantisbacteria bacterium CG1_02_49_89]PIV55464.1 MAG: TrpB-like pyridoxal phosphate-dependent enzyme [Candidatus Desantisbacteria bacterium CG02_land_8_20_14_3_00_49_13]PIZ15352.1 MAG: TrpB-like pyridoxal phosphate-dependent enzyme [Candidatus Desantisbacteria bacterium CG_4_10_14_0_8_um_filter_48_22]PJB28076.1 MAG: TrpB-like pyridoxal phosphate-dependent enzyme [Candidatus Desantisbacteria bacterium CG_4_9_14_3_um_filter_50_7]